ncbi:MAG: zinc ribbon domain-containing protein [Pseudomonadota bacterium]
MPIFEFKCRKCGKPFERIVFLALAEQVGCPACGSLETERVPSGFSSIRSVDTGAGATCGARKRFS